jgi:peptidoglycan-associated lipoprotein
MIQPLRLLILLSLSIFLLSIGTACSTKNSKSSYGDNSYEDDGSRSSLSENDLAVRDRARFGDGSIPFADDGDSPFRDIYFDFDSSTLGARAKQELEANGEILRQNPRIKINIEGHTDSRGTLEYNMQLGEARARAAKDYLLSIGISEDRLNTISYGENIPLESGNSEESWQRNRRVHSSPTR